MKKDHVSSIPPEFLSLMKAILSKPLMVQSPQSPCPKCDATTTDIIKMGRLGCSECYSHFQAGISTILARCQQAATQHVGKIPQKWIKEQEKRLVENEAALDKKERIQNIKEKMKKAIAIENYEVAGVLNKKIEEIQQE